MRQHPQSTAKIAGHPIHPMLIPFPIAGFLGTFVSDIVFAVSDDPFWAAMSFYLLSAGIVMAALAAVAGFIDFFGDQRLRQHNAAWHHMLGNLAVVLLEVTNWLIRETPGNTDILPGGLLISAAVSIILLYTGWRGWELVYKHRTGVADDGES